MDYLCFEKSMKFRFAIDQPKPRFGSLLKYFVLKIKWQKMEALVDLFIFGEPRHSFVNIRRGDREGPKKFPRISRE